MTEHLKLESQKKKVPRKVTAKSLENAGLYYLQRFPSSCENFRRVMMRRVNRSARYYNTNPEVGAKIIDVLIKKFIKIGLLNDLRYAEFKVINFRRRGLSERMIRAKLAERRVSTEVINDIFQLLNSNNSDLELNASIIFSRRTRLGAFRGSQDKHQKFREKDMAKLARAGFSYNVAQKILGIETREELEQMVDNYNFGQ